MTLTSNNLEFYIFSIFLIINFLAFLIMLADKLKSATPGAERISEGQLFFLAVVFGGLGVYAGMLVFKHKTRKWYFIVGIPLLIIQNITTIYLLFLFLFN